MNQPGKRSIKIVSANQPKAEDPAAEDNVPRFNRIKAVLAEKNILSKELAQRMHKTPGSVSNWCTNLKQPSIETLFEIAKAIGVEPAELLNTVKNAGV